VGLILQVPERVRAPERVLVPVPELVVSLAPSALARALRRVLLALPLVVAQLPVALS
jgi:hypothetical protein